ncbi:MAG TPA: DUF5522 domain-containing protein [Ilumatobacteraceae bacterium]|nr:DUF5522 domain-containing protein [Ilumatobacteraceae bacterium]
MPGQDGPTLRAEWRHRPHPRRLAAGHPQRDEILRRHAEAMESGVPVYLDPHSRLSVFTAEFLVRRGYCCESGCRHCPYVID